MLLLARLHCFHFGTDFVLEMGKLIARTTFNYSLCSAYTDTLLKPKTVCISGCWVFILAV